MSKAWKTFAIWVGLIVLFFTFFQFFRTKSPAAPVRSLQSFKADVEANQIDSVRADNEGNLIVTDEEGRRYRIDARGIDPDLWKKLQSSGVRLEAPEQGSNWSSSLGTWLPLVVLLGVFFFFLRKNAGGQWIFTLRKTTARLAQTPAVTFADVGGATDAKERLADVVDFLKRPRAWEASGAHLPSGVLLEGPPGSGKTLLARAMAGEAKVPFFEVSASEFVELFVGVGAARMRDLFEQAAKKVPAVIFIDELDAVGRRRGAASIGAGHQEREQTLNQLLVCLDGFRKRKGVVVVAATNRADILDAALLRPGRFDVRLKLPPLSSEARAQVLSIHLRPKPVGNSVDTASVAAQTESYTGAQLENLVNEAALEAVRRSRRAGNVAVTIEAEDFRAALAAQSVRKSEFDQLDAVLIESGSQLSQPNANVSLRATLQDGSEASGEVVWADERFLKLKAPDGSTTAVAKGSIARIEALAGTAPASLDQIFQDRWARMTPDSI
jgi:cell division protease FtsH